MSIRSDRHWRLLVSCCTSIAAANLTAWAATRAELAPAAAVGAAILVAAACGLAAWRVAGPAGLLSWEGGLWQWAPGGEAACTGRAEVMLDLGVWVLLRFELGRWPRRALWLPVSSRQADGEWAAWRAALYARQVAQAGKPPDDT